jgi:transcription termination/antitermination protein NusA
MLRWLRKASQQARESTEASANETSRVEADFDFKRRALGVNDELKNVPGVTTPMLVAFGESGIKTIDDLAGCATDDLVGWTEIKTSAALRHAGILDDFGVSRKDCEAMIMYARVKAGWIDGP